jgi:hypothetical protein
MAQLFGQVLSRQDLARRTGDLSQVAGIRLLQLVEGREAGVRVADLRTGSGLHFQVSLDRGMDLSLADYKGMALAWRSPVGDVHPSFFEPAGYGWLRTFPGGLLTGCGMTSAGAPSEDQGEALGLHGRLSHLPATDVSSMTRWAGAECVFTLQGTMREYSPFHENLTLHRTIEAFLGKSVFLIRDVVRNEASAPSPLMMLYHLNCGWPLLDEGSRLLLRARSTTPRDRVAEAGTDLARQFSGPVAGYQEQVFYHDCMADQDGFSTALLANEHLELGFFVRYRQNELPHFAEWKMMGEGTYVMGMEPANCSVGGRGAERASGSLQHLSGGEQREFLLHLGVLEGEDELRDFIRRHDLQ